MLAIIAVIASWLALCVTIAFFVGLIRFHDRLMALEVELQHLGRVTLSKLEYQQNLIRALPTKEAVEECIKTFSN